MRKLIDWFKGKGVAAATLFLLAFIPLYPKLPLIDIKHTWVYIRGEDFVVLFILLYWGFLVIRRNLTLRTPLTIPILLFWLAGLVSTLHGILLIFPGLSDAFPTIALLSMLRRIEYMSVFFLAYSAAGEKRFLSSAVVVLTTTLFLVVGYAFGQRYVGFPAFLTMNEEFAKGIAIQLSPLSRVSSTFGGHYDLAAYLTFILPILFSLIFGYRQWFVRAIFAIAIFLGLIVLFMTVSRISFFALFIALGLVLFFQKRKLVILAFPPLALGIILFLSFSPSLLERFGGTLREIDVLVDVKTGQPVGQVKETPKAYFENKVVKQQFSKNIGAIVYPPASPSAELIIPFVNLPDSLLMLIEPAAPTGEDLPSGTSYVNLALSPVIKRLGNFIYESKPKVATSSPDVYVINGDYLEKKALTYDLSFSTRFQGEWPRAISAFIRNIFLGSGYGSVSMAVDNSYLRMFGEVGLLGSLSFMAIFVILAVYLRSVLPSIDSRQERSFLFGVISGFTGLAINALFIDVFEASKIAFLLWLVVGVTLGLVQLYRVRPLSIFRELKRIAVSPYAIAAYLLIAVIVLFSTVTRNYFVGDDFTWFRWASECAQSVANQRCPGSASTIVRYFTQAQGFFYRPGAKMYFLLMYEIFWLNQTAYHLASLFLHFVVAVLVYLLARKIFRNGLLSAVSAFLFLTLSGFSEVIFWVSATGFLFTTLLTLSSLLSYIAWTEKKKTSHWVAALVFALLSPLFHEMGIVTPLLLLVYQWTHVEPIVWRKLWKDFHYRTLLLIIPGYLVVRWLAGSHGLSGDYNYNLLKLPFNAVGNVLGYMSLTLIGPLSMSFYQAVRTLLRANIVLALAISAGALAALPFAYHAIKKLLTGDEMNIFLFGLLFFITSLLPFLGLGNIASRYGYLSSIGMIFLFVLLIKKAYEYLLINGKDIAMMIIAIGIGLFSLLQIVELGQMQSDWYESGETVRRFFIGMNSVYDDSWKTGAKEFHFVNVPIRHGEAWVFPVGIPDALWFVFRNPSLKVYQWNSLSQAFDAVGYDPKTQKILVFDNSGELTEVRKPLPDAQ